MRQMIPDKEHLCTEAEFNSEFGFSYKGEGFYLKENKTLVVELNELGKHLKTQKKLKVYIYEVGFELTVFAEHIHTREDIR